jgi:hypothetical protein
MYRHAEGIYPWRPRGLGLEAALSGHLRGSIESSCQSWVAKLPAADGRHMNAGGGRGLTKRCAVLAGSQQSLDDSRTIASRNEKKG